MLYLHHCFFTDSSYLITSSTNNLADSSDRSFEMILLMHRGLALGLSLYVSLINRSIVGLSSMVLLAMEQQPFREHRGSVIFIFHNYFFLSFPLFFFEILSVGGFSPLQFSRISRFSAFQYLCVDRKFIFFIPFSFLVFR